MIVDSRIHGHKDCREFTVNGAMKFALELLEHGQTMEIEKVIDYKGDSVTLNGIRVLVSSVSRVSGRSYKTKKTQTDGLIVTRMR